MLDGGLKEVTDTDGMNIPGDVISILEVVAMLCSVCWSGSQESRELTKLTSTLWKWNWYCWHVDIGDTYTLIFTTTHQLLSFVVDRNNICALDWRNCFQLKLTGERPGEPPPVQHGHGWSRENGSNVIIMYCPVGWVKMYYFQFLKKLQRGISLSICQ